MNARMLKSITLAMLGALASLLALTGLLAPEALAAPPVATPVYAPTAEFGFRDPIEEGLPRKRIAVDPGTGNILFTDQQAGVVEVFGSDTNPLTSINTGGAPYGIAIDQATGAVYVSNSASDTIKRYVSDGAATPTYTVDGTFTSPAHGNGASQIGSFDSALAVDPVTHDLLVADSENERVDRYSATGGFLGSFDGSGAPGGSFSALTDIAVGPDGTVYVIDGALVERFSAAGVSEGSLPAKQIPTAITADPTNGGVAVATQELDGYGQMLQQFDAAGEPLTEVSYCCNLSGVRVSGIAIDGTSHRLYALSGGSGYEDGAIFELTSVLPGVEILAPSSTGLTTAHFAGEVDPGGVPTTIRFEYSSDQGASWTSTSEVEVGAGSGAQEASLDSGGLYPGRSYLVRMVATNSAQHRTSRATNLTMPVAPPAVETGGSSEVEDTSAAVYGSLNPNGFQTTFYFEYGQTESYGSRIPVASDGVAGQGLVARQLARTISGLAPQTTYHYRLTAQSSVGRTVGLDRTFTTAATSGAEGRVYEQVTPVHKEGGTIDSNVAFQAEGNGEGFVFKTTNTLGGSASESSAFFARYMSLRTPSGWTGAQPLDPPVRSTYAFVSYPTLAVSGDFTHAFVATDRALAPGAVSGDANLYIRDLRTGQYTFVGTSSTPGALNQFIGLGPANKYIAGAPDFSWIVFNSPMPLLPEAKAGSLYRWSATSGLSIESVLPDGSPAGEVGVSPAQQLPIIHRVSEDGSRDFFAVNEAGAEGVYMRTGGHTTALSVSRVPGDPATPLRGLIMGVSADGNYAVFESGRLTSDAPPSAVEDVYRYDVTSGQLQYLGLQAGAQNFLVSDDGQAVYVYGGEPKVFYHGTVSSIPAGAGYPGVYDASPDGRYYAFSPSEGSDAEVYLYDAEAHTVTCVSCLPGGEVSAGDARLPDPETSISNRVPRAVNDSGQVFFDTAAKLVPADVNGMRDVYVYQADRVRLISPGDAPFDARFADSSEDGSDVFFSTAQSLVGQDQDGVSDIYDARIGGGIPEQSELEKPNCPGSECAEFSVPRADSAQIASESLTLPAAAGGSPSSAVRRKVTVSVTKVATGSASLRISVRVSEKGRIRVSGVSLTATARTVKKAGTYTLVVPLSAKAKAARRAHRKLKVKAKVLLTGSSGSATSSISRTLGN
jgi:DNA-binding beta-propeller fold protein YncE